MPKPRPEYDINEFLTACYEACEIDLSRVALENWVLDKASDHFNLKTKRALLEFIANGGLQQLEFINSADYRLSKDIPPSKCDSYKFISGFIEGYLSFYYRKVSKRWIIKSFHRLDDSYETTISLAIRKAGLSMEYDKRTETNGK